MVGPDDVGQPVVIRPADDFYRFIDGTKGILTDFDGGYGVVHVPDASVDLGYKQFLVPPSEIHRDNEEPTP